MNSKVNPRTYWHLMQAFARKKVLILADWYLPGFKAGGPIQSVAAIVANLSDEFEFFVLTSDRDFGVDHPYPDISTGVWIQSNGCKVMYLSPDASVKRTLLKALAELDPHVVYFNSLFSQRFTLEPLRVLRNFPELTKILAPRGMLGAGALAIKPLKKKLYLFIAKLLGLYRHVRWHASSEQEKFEVQKVFGVSADVRVALNLTRNPDAGKLSRRAPKPPGKARFFFLSRISRKKNLLIGLQWLEQLEESEGVSFDIIGPVEDEAYWADCQAIISRLELKGIAVTHHGAIEPHRIPLLLSECHFLLLPTFHENFGHVVVESMACGCPVIISQNTPWRGLEAIKAGWDLPLDEPAAFMAVLTQAVAMDESKFSIWSEQAQQFAAEHSNSPATIEANRTLFR